MFPIVANLSAFVAQLTEVDDVSIVLLKGHLLIEESLNRIIETFVHHGDQLADARLTFAHKVAIARSMSLDEANNPMWELVLSLNSLRNQLAHSLDPDRRQGKLARLREHYTREAATIEDKTMRESATDNLLVTNAVGLSLGFLSSFEDEVLRFRQIIAALDKEHNPHRHR